MCKRLILLLLLIGVGPLHAGCGYLAAAGAGAAIGHEAAEEDEDGE